MTLTTASDIPRQPFSENLILKLFIIVFGLEWAVADIFFPSQGAAYLGSQGDVWDAQKDMGLAFTGAILIMLIASSLKKITK